MSRLRFLIGFFLVIFGLNCLYRILHSQVSHYSTENEVVQNASFVNLLPKVLDEQLFVFDPHVLSEALGASRMNELRWRFDLPKFAPVRNTLIMAMFGHQKASFAGRADVTEVARVEGRLPFSKKVELLHLFLRWRDLKVHVVVLHQVKHFLWIGQIPESLMPKLQQFNVLFGKFEEIYDPFKLNRIGAVQFPDEIAHFLGQIPTSRYIHCPPERNSWFHLNNVAISKLKIASSEEAIIGVKSLMKKLQMQFWIACGTLLGWYRQCHVTPYTSDTDFATWSRYLEGKSITDELQTLAPKHNLKLYYRFGEPLRSMEYSLMTETHHEKADVFFVYPTNQTHVMVPIHMVDRGTFAYQFYPKYELCSVELLGYKLLGPCHPELIIVTEYGPQWKEPVSTWSFFDSPHNTGPHMAYTFGGTQVEEFSSFKQWALCTFLVIVILIVIYLFLGNHFTRVYSRLTL